MLPCAGLSKPSSKRPFASDDSSSEDDAPHKKARREAGLPGFSRLSISPQSDVKQDDAPMVVPGELAREWDPHVVYVDRLTDSEDEVQEEQTPSSDGGQVMSVEFPQLLADKLSQLGKEESLLPFPTRRPEMSLVLYQPVFPPSANANDDDDPEGDPNTQAHQGPAPPSSPEQAPSPLEDGIEAMDLD